MRKSHISESQLVRYRFAKLQNYSLADLVVVRRCGNSRFGKLRNLSLADLVQVTIISGIAKVKNIL